MWQYLAAQSYGDAFCSLGQQEWELDGQGDGLLVATIVGELPFCGLGVEDYVECEFRQACLDVTSGGSIVAREDITPVALTVYEQVFLTELYECVLDACIAVGVKLHGMPHDIGNLVVPAVVHAFHRVQDTSLYGFESIAYVRDGTLQYDV